MVNTLIIICIWYNAAYIYIYMIFSTQWDYTHWIWLSRLDGIKQPQWSSGSQAIVKLSSWDDVILKASCSVLYVYRQAYYSVSVMENEQML